MDNRSFHDLLSWLGLFTTTLVTLFLCLGVGQARAKQKRDELPWLVPLAGSFLARIVIEWFFVAAWNVHLRLPRSVYTFLSILSSATGFVLLYAACRLWSRLKRGPRGTEAARAEAPAGEAAAGDWPPPPSV